MNLQSDGNIPLISYSKFYGEPCVLKDRNMRLFWDAYKWEHYTRIVGSFNPSGI